MWMDKLEQMELKLLRDKCLIFNQFISEKGMIPPQLKDAYEESNRLIEAAYIKGKSKYLKSMSVDIDDQVRRHMPLHLAQELRKIFREKLNINYDAVNIASTKTINRILKKGRISNVKEYQLLLNKTDEIYTNPNEADMVTRINELLASYESKL